MTQRAPDRFMMDGHKLLYHLDRAAEFLAGRRIAPLHIDVGLSKGCNIRCSYCFGALQGNLYGAGEGVYFPREPLMRYLSDAGKAGVRSMAFIGEAEPLMNPHVWEAIVHAKAAGVDVALGTNGLLFDTGEAGVEALKCLTWLRFNLSAATPEAYRTIHGSPDFDLLLAKIAHCVAVKRRLNLEVTIGLQMVLTPENACEAVGLAKLGAALGVDYLVIKQCSDTVEGELGVFNRLGEYHSLGELLAEAETCAAPGYEVIVKWRKVTNEGRRQYRACLGAPFLLYSSGDGKLFPCGAFFTRRAEEFMLGDLTKESFIDILSSERYGEVMKKVAAIDVTAECYANCRTDAINDFAWRLLHPPAHVNFV